MNPTMAHKESENETTFVVADFPDGKQIPTD